MSLTNLTKDALPVKEDSSIDEKITYCGNFTGELSSITGIYSKFLYISRLKENKLTGEVLSLPPTVRILCGPECKEHCINLNRNLNNDISKSNSTQ